MVVEKSVGKLKLDEAGRLVRNVTPKSFRGDAFELFSLFPRKITAREIRQPESNLAEILPDLLVSCVDFHNLVTTDKEKLSKMQITGTPQCERNTRNLD
jgi:hypothetical protein